MILLSVVELIKPYLAGLLLGSGSSFFFGALLNVLYDELFLVTQVEEPEPF